MMPDYLDYCDKALTKHGSCVGDTLASRQHFHEWIYTQKAEDIVSNMNMFLCSLHSQTQVDIS